jgi:hypothetical protein
MRLIVGSSSAITFGLKAFITSERSLVCFGGSESKIESACSQLNVSQALFGCLG